MLDFSGKTVLITGAAQGFGRVCALAFAERGTRLALCDIEDGGGAGTLKAVEGAGASAGPRRSPPRCSTSPPTRPASPPARC